MLKKLIVSLLGLAACTSLLACSNSKNQYKDDKYWYQSGRTISDEKPDVFYIVSTVVYSSYDEDGNETEFANLNNDDLELMNEEISDLATNTFTEQFNFFAPYYHELTMSTFLGLPSSRREEYLSTISEEINSAFDYYYSKWNNGRPFVIAGYSQGSVLAKRLVKHLNKDQLNRMAAAYIIGGTITADDLTHENIKYATKSDDLHVVANFNSVENLDACYELITEINIKCINPINWKTDSTPATFTYKGTEATVHIDENNHVLIVGGLNPADYYLPDWPFPYGNYHNEEIHFYASSIRENALLRLSKLEETK